MSLHEHRAAPDREETPRWLADFDPADPPEASYLVREFLGSRVVFYPGAGDDGSVVKQFNEARWAHCFLYVDYGLTRPTIEDNLQARGFRGYRNLARIDVAEEDLGVGRWTPHVPPCAVNYWFPPVAPFAFLEILERLPAARIDGAERLAVLLLAADGHATYDALFCQPSGSRLFCAVLQDHGWGLNHSDFGATGLMEQVADASQRYPEYLLVGDNTKPWTGYAAAIGTAPYRAHARRFRSLYVGERIKLADVCL